MKSLLISFLLFTFAVTSRAQFTSSHITAAGLTCAMCTKAIYNSLKKLPFVESVDADIRNSGFVVKFRKDAEVDIDRLKLAVMEAGFSVSTLSLTGQFDNVAVNNDSHVNINGKTFHFLHTSSQTLRGEKTLKVVDKDFVSSKEFKKYSSYTNMACVQTGKAASCCARDGIIAEARIYHVTI